MMTKNSGNMLIRFRENNKIRKISYAKMNNASTTTYLVYL